jgi:hypothetical protein
MVLKILVKMILHFAHLIAFLLLLVLLGLHTCYTGAVALELYPEPSFAFSYFSDRVLSFCLELALNHNLPTSASYVAGIT